VLVSASAIANPIAVSCIEGQLVDGRSRGSWGPFSLCCWSGTIKNGVRLPAMNMRAKTMTDDFNTPLEEPGTASKIVDGIKVASSAVGDAIETGLEPGMPLDIVVRAVREAPLAALGIAFMLGFVFARPRR
jgi:hypothetical protein